MVMTTLPEPTTQEQSKPTSMVGEYFSKLKNKKISQAMKEVHRRKRIANPKPKKPKFKKREDGKRATGRPESITEEKIKMLEEALKHDFTVAEACAYAGVSRDSYYRKIKNDPEFAYKMDAAQRFCFFLAKKTVRKGLLDESNPDFALKRLSKRQPELYSERTQMYHDGSITSKIVVLPPLVSQGSINNYEIPEDQIHKISETTMSLEYQEEENNNTSDLSADLSTEQEDNE